MLQLYVIPAELHKRVIDADPNLYFGLGKVESIDEVFSLTDRVAMSEATNRFKLQLDTRLPITIGKCPLGLYGTDPKYARQAEEMSWQLKLNLQKAVDPNTTTYKYGLYPVGGDVWVVVEQRVHEVPSHLKQPSLALNQEFFAQLIGAVHNYVPFHVLASTELFSNYLKATTTRSK